MGGCGFRCEGWVAELEWYVLGGLYSSMEPNLVRLKKNVKNKS